MVESETVNKGQEPRSQTAITFFSDTGLDELETHRLRAATSILQMRLRDVLREELGGTYSVGVGYSDTAPQPGYGTTSVQFGSSPENAERLRNVVLTELDKLRRDGPTESEVGIVKETERRELETALRQNGYWLNSLQAVHLLGAIASHPAADRENGIARDRQYPRSPFASISSGSLHGRHVDAGERRKAGRRALTRNRRATETRRNISS